MTRDEAIKILKDTKDPHIAKAIKHEQRVRLHTEPTVEQTDNPAYGEYLSRVKERIPSDAYERFISLIEWPFVTVDFTEGVFSPFQAIFETTDRYVNVSFTNPDYNTDFEPIKSNVESWFKTNAVNYLKTRFNSFLVVNMPVKQEGSRPDPYFYCVPISWVVRVSVDMKNKCNYIAFKNGEKDNDGRDVIEFICDEHYRKFVEKQGSFTAIYESTKFDIGWCPVVPYWGDVLDATVTMLNKKMPATSSLGKLYTLAFKEHSKEHSDLYCLFPMLWTYPEEEDEKRIDEVNQMAPPENEYPITYQSSLSNKFLSAPARHLIKPIPDRDNPDIGEPAGFISAEVENLKFIVEDIQRRKADLEYSIAGKPGEPKNDQAKNEKQIASGYESRNNVLINAANNFSQTEKFVLKTMAALRYGKDAVKSVSVNAGKNFFVMNHREVMEDIKEAKDAGAPFYILDQQERQYTQSKYRANPEKMARMDMLRVLMPYRNMTTDEVIRNIAQLDPIKAQFRLEFSNLIDEFETKFGPVESFMPDEEMMDLRIMQIKKELLELLIIQRNAANTRTTP